MSGVQTQQLWCGGASRVLLRRGLAQTGCDLLRHKLTCATVVHEVELHDLA